NPPADRGATAARGENNAAERTNPETSRPGQPNAMTTNRPANNSVVHPKDLPAYENPSAPNTGNAKLDQKYQQQQDKLAQQQDKERQKLQSQQDKEHQQLTMQKANDQRT